MSADKARKYPPDRLILAVDERRPAILDVIRKARRRLVLSLFRCNDEAIFNELTYAVDRGVAVDVIITSRAKGGRGKLDQLRAALDQTGATVKTYTDQVVKYHAKYLIADDGPAVVASLNFTRKCFRKTCDALVITHDLAIVDDLRRLWTADRDRQRDRECADLLGFREPAHQLPARAIAMEHERGGKIFGQCRVAAGVHDPARGGGQCVVAVDGHVGGECVVGGVRGSERGQGLQCHRPREGRTREEAGGGAEQCNTKSGVHGDPGRSPL